MEDPNLKKIFTDNHVYAFRRAFPAVDFSINPDEYGLNKVYDLVCNCNEDNLMSEIIGSSSGLYSGISKVPKIILLNDLYTPNDYHHLDSLPILDTLPYGGPDSALNMINAQNAWGYTHGDTAIKIGICDRNLDDSSQWSHEDILGKIIYWDTVHGDYGNLHGLVVSGCAAGNTDNFRGKSSIGFNCRLMFSSQSAGDSTFNALLNLSLKGAKVLNVSWLGGNFDQDEQNMINKITENGTLVVAAAGNEQRGYQYPASYANVLSVTGVAYNYHHENWEHSLWNWNDAVDISAPGYKVIALNNSCDSCYSRASGSSFASPIVAGTAGLIFSINHCLTPKDVTDIIKSTANDTIYKIADNQKYKDSLGSGSLDAGAAVKKAYLYYCARDYDIQNGQSIVWDSTKYIDNEIIIEPGGTLTIRGKVLFNKYAKITVSIGGKLIVDGGWLTNNCACSLWSGIDVYGNSHASQYYDNQQGVVELKNNALIENAVLAVRTLIPIPTKSLGPPWAFLPSCTGGIIRATNTTFRNNQMAVLFLPYENFVPIDHRLASNFSYFNSCTFETTKKLADASNPQNFVELNGVRDIIFGRCIFRNTISNAQRNQRGNGIYALNSSIYVKPICLDIYQPCVHELPSIFSQLNYGIKCLGTDPTKPAFIDKSVFINNYTGIYLGSVQYATVTRDTFTVLPAYSNASDTVSGLYLDQCHAYIIEENSFSSFYTPGAPSVAKSVGISVNNTNLGNYFDVDNKIYNNRLEKLNYGILPMNKNRNDNGNHGLQLICNDFIYPNEFDIAVTKEPSTSLMGIRDPQGSNGTGKTDPANNQFSYTHDDSTSDLFNEDDNIIYWYLTNNNGANLDPINHSSSVNPQTNNANLNPFNKSECCPSSFTSGGGGGIDDLITQKNDAKQKVDSIAALLELLVDGGDTPGTNQTIQTSNSNQTIEVTDDLMSKSPYLSDTVMVSAAGKEDVLPPAVITEVLAANPQSAKSQSVMQTLENRINPLSEDQLADIEQGLSIFGARESLEMMEKKNQMDYNYSLYKIISHYKNDSRNPYAEDSIIWYLNAEDQLWAKYSLVFEYLNNGDTSDAENILNDIPTIFHLSEKEYYDYQQYIAYYNLLKEFLSENNTIADIDSTQSQGLFNIMNNSTGLVSGYARNILSSNSQLVYKELYIFPDDSLKSSKVRHEKKNKRCQINSIKIYPNPAKSYVVVEYILSSSTENTKIELYDPFGKNLISKNLRTTHDWLVIPLENLPSGTYFCILKIGNKSVASNKIILVK